MLRATLALGLLLVSACLGGSPGTTPAPPSTDGTEHPTPPGVGIETFIDGLSQPVQIIDRGDGAFLIVEQGGRVLVHKDGGIASAPFLDLSALVSTGNEQGLLGLALAPDYEASGRFFVDYTDRAGDTQIVRYGRSALDPDRADPLTARTILTVDQPYSNHNGGLVLFGPDEMLYVGLGDGGNGGDPHDNAQNLESLLGKILRLDVSGDAYTVPADNPFASGGGRGEVWAFGLRNPWRFSFDRTSGDLYIGDVGQNAIEEVDYAPASSRGGENYGWNLFEGSHRYGPGEADDLVPPVAEYDHAGRHCSVVGGYVYRGEKYPSLAGVYLYADYCSGTLWGLWPKGDGWHNEVLLETGRHVSSFGEDNEGELYLVDHDGEILGIIV